MKTFKMVCIKKIFGRMEVLELEIMTTIFRLRYKLRCNMVFKKRSQTDYISNESKGNKLINSYMHAINPSAFI